jgi:hypothetical protein
LETNGNIQVAESVAKEGSISDGRIERAFGIEKKRKPAIGRIEGADRIA